jgi:RES domain
VIDFPGEHPEPPSDLATREPLLAEMQVGAILSRLHAKGKSPLFFGRTGGNRVDSPDFTYGVLYAGLDEYCSFIETYGQTTGIRTVTESSIDGRHLAHLELLRPMKLIDLSNSGGLARTGADSRLFSGSHAVAQRWSAALRGHPSKPDGILYPARHDAARNACAIYECPPSVFELHAKGSLLEHQHSALLGAILDCYGFALIP